VSETQVHMRLLLIWSRTHSVPGHLVPHNWSPRTNSPGSFGPHAQMVPKTIGPQEQTVPAHLVPMDKWSPRQLVPLDNWSPKFVSIFQMWFDIWWSTFDITDDFKPISKMFFSCFGEIKQSLFFLFSSNIIL
jgi:hypothetical protein